ncbi:hypothetical protein [Vagococcus acidifermentans]|uniref:Uncharacterized protein n=1 Tax=Vagococcus acidifermentans TaxID=564710 RepID=A0A430B0D5_9ENTE|nr:hypothetical protein [Vagococcus acidifermentans]RSU13807.1 hypothetical protein CBF27_02600 [Vagococcus acidifermentans]
MTQQDWLYAQIASLEASSQQYEDRAFFQELREIVQEQYKRIEQAEGEIDGTIWSPRNWS